MSMGSVKVSSCIIEGLGWKTAHGETHFPDDVGPGTKSMRTTCAIWSGSNAINYGYLQLYAIGLIGTMEHSINVPSGDENIVAI